MSLLLSLVGAVLFCALYYGLWRAWCRHAPQWLPADAPGWAKQPSLGLFVLVSFVLLLLYRKASR